MGYWKELGLGGGDFGWSPCRVGETLGNCCTALNLSFWVLISQESQVLPDAGMKSVKVRPGTSWETCILDGSLKGRILWEAIGWWWEVSNNRICEEPWKPSNPVVMKPLWLIFFFSPTKCICFRTDVNTVPTVIKKMHQAIDFLETHRILKQGHSPREPTFKLRRRDAACIY